MVRYQKGNRRKCWRRKNGRLKSYWSKNRRNFSQRHIRSLSLLSYIWLGLIIYLSLLQMMERFWKINQNNNPLKNNINHRIMIQSINNKQHRIECFYQSKRSKLYSEPYVKKDRNSWLTVISNHLWLTESWGHLDNNWLIATLSISRWSTQWIYTLQELVRDSEKSSSFRTASIGQYKLDIKMRRSRRINQLYYHRSTYLLNLIPKKRNLSI